MTDRRGSDRVARLISLKVLHDNKSIEELENEMNNVQILRGGVPVAFTNNTKSSFDTIAPIIAADGSEVASYGAAPSRVCGQCRKFNIASGRKAMVEQRFAEVLVRDHRWQLKHLGVPLDHVGMCDESAGTRLTCSISNADSCDAFRKR